MKENPSKAEIFLERVEYETVDFLDECRRFHIPFFGVNTILAPLVDKIIEKNNEKYSRYNDELRRNRRPGEESKLYVPHFKRKKAAEQNDNP